MMKMLKSYHFLRHLHPPPHMSQLKRQLYQSDENPVTTLVVAEFFLSLELVNVRLSLVL
ncbi:hypothetical protein GBA52_019442 [Prunus armeniaca]|nr:hypothetical protein GBA52_019442 [Prunus armeniaca]